MPDGSAPISRRSVAGTSRSSSALGFRLGLPFPAAPSSLEREVVLLRAARRRGISTFEIGGGAGGPAAERALSRAFPEPDPELLVIVRRSLRSLTAGGASATGASKALDLPGQLLASIEESSGRLRPHRVDLVRWSDGDASAAVAGAARTALRALQEEGRIVGWIEELGGGPGPGSLSTGGEPHSALCAGPLSLLAPGAVAPLAERARREPIGFFADDPLADGHLDGSRFRPVPVGDGPGRGPASISELEREARPVLQLAFLTAGTGRTLAQAAIEFALRWPWVTCAVLPVPAPERLGEIADSERAPPLQDAEVERIFALGDA